MSVSAVCHHIRIDCFDENISQGENKNGKLVSRIALSMLTIEWDSKNNLK